MNKMAKRAGEWIEENTDTATPVQTLWWFVAYEEALAMHETYTVKDWANTLQSGIPAQTEETVDAYFEAILENVGDEDFWHEVETNLKNHFGQ